MITDIDGLTGGVAEIVDDHSDCLFLGPGMDAHPRIDGESLILVVGAGTDDSLSSHQNSLVIRGDRHPRSPSRVRRRNGSAIRPALFLIARPAPDEHRFDPLVPIDAQPNTPILIYRIRRCQSVCRNETKRLLGGHCTRCVHRKLRLRQSARPLLRKDLRKMPTLAEVSICLGSESTRRAIRFREWPKSTEYPRTCNFSKYTSRQPTTVRDAPEGRLGAGWPELTSVR